MKLLIMIFWLLFGAASSQAEGIYLLKIDSDRQLDKLMNTIGQAHGMIDQQFIISADNKQHQALIIAGIKLTTVTEHFSLDELYLVSMHHPTWSRTALSFTPVYTSGDRHIVPLERSSIAILAREGYMARPLSEKKTPFFYQKRILPAAAFDSYPADTMADLIVQDSLQSYNQRLEDFYTRFTPTDSNHAARDWIQSKFQSFGYNDVFLHPLHSTREWMGVIYEPAWNIVCRKVGTVYPDKWIVIGGHYDSYASNGYDDPAPGADDDATGVSTALEMARILKDFPTKRSYMFCGFGAEEQWMDGTDSLALYLYEQGIEVEFVLNVDMIAYLDMEIDSINLMTTGDPYFNVMTAAAGRVSTAVTRYYSNATWDAEAFLNYGAYGMTVHEIDLHPLVHTPYDLCSSLDFRYMNEVVRMLTAGLMVIDGAIMPIECQTYDMGDGQSIKVSWDSCITEYSYKILYGTDTYHLDDTLDVPPGECEYIIEGLTEGAEYLISVYPVPDEGYPPLYHIFSEQIPLMYPRAPENVVAGPDLNAININWLANQELDISHYRISRKMIGEIWTTLADDYLDTFLIDGDVYAGEEYMYVVQAVDNDGFVSDSSNIARSFPATFDQGLLFVEETQSGGSNPSGALQNTFYQNMLDGYTYTQIRIDSADEAVTRPLAGQHTPIIYVDDDDYIHRLENSIDTLQWFLGYETDMLLAGWESIYSVTGQTNFYPGDFYYEQLGLSQIGRCVIADFTGASGENDWPDLILKPDAPSSGRLPNIQIFSEAPGAEVISRFESFSGNPYYDGKPVGVAYDTYHGKRVVLGFPLFWLTEESAAALINKTMTYFASTSEFVYGDVNEDRIVNLIDITYLINYLYQDGPPPIRINHGDPNDDCAINILDISYLITYLYNAGAAPTAGCVE